MDAAADHEVPQYLEQHSEPRFTKLSYGAGHPRRYGSYFGPSPTVIESRISQESDGTWEFVTPPPVPAFEGTEAQRVAMMYGNESFYSDNSDSTLASPPPMYESGQESLKDDHEPPWEKPYTPIVEGKGSRVTYDLARQRGLLAVFQEAMDTTNKFYLHSAIGDRIPCPRGGCKDLLANAHGLIYHLHIHDIHDNLVICPHCKVTYENPSDVHSCPQKHGLRRKKIFRTLRLSRINFFSHT